MPDDPASLSGLRPGASLRIGGASVLAIERVAVRSSHGEAWGWISAVVEPVAVVVRDPLGTRAIGMDGAPMELGTLVERVPGLAAILEMASG